jgi:hypothetical protein
MSRQSTALLTVGPRTIAPWGDRAWRVSGTAQLVEGSSAYWIVTPTQPANHPATPSEVDVLVPAPDTVVESLLLLLAVHFGDDQLAEYLVEHHNLTIDDAGVRVVAPYWELAGEVISHLARNLSQTVRLGVTLLDDISLMDDEVIDTLRGLGFDVDVFAPTLGVPAR